jgi:AP-3 complex subunit sigma
VGVWGKDTKLVYRVYATLYFVVIVDGSESELGILDLIHVFVEALDHIFENVCELDLIFHSDKVHYILDEIIMGGMVLETNLQDVLLGIREQEVLEAGDSKVAQARLKIAEKLK